MSCFFDNGVQHSLVILLIQNFHYYWNAFFLPYQKARTWDPGRPQQDPTKTRKLGPRTVVGPQIDPKKPENWEQGSQQDPRKTLQKLENWDLGHQWDPSMNLQKPKKLGPRTLSGPYKNQRTGTLAGHYKNKKTRTQDPSRTLQKNRNLGLGTLQKLGPQ